MGELERILQCAGLCEGQIEHRKLVGNIKVGLADDGAVILTQRLNSRPDVIAIEPEYIHDMIYALVALLSHSRQPASK